MYILTPVMVVTRLLQMARGVVMRESRLHGSILVQLVRNPFDGTRKEFCAMVAVNGITLTL